MIAVIAMRLNFLLIRQNNSKPPRGTAIAPRVPDINNPQSARRAIII